jgi:hypothetical protein
MKTKKLQKWAHVAEITGAIAVVISLIYVGYQIKENTSAQHSQTDVELTSMGFAWDAWYQNQDFVAAVAKANQDYGSLGNIEKLQFDKHVSMGLNLWVFAFDSFSRGQMEQDVWEAWNAYFMTEIQRNSWRMVWNTKRKEYPPDFAMHVDATIADQEN